jgi:hypothetical protein
MATAADKRRWDDLHASYATAREAARAYESQLRSRYGYSDSRWRSWITRTERTKLERLEARADKIGDKIVDLLVRISPRGEAWLTGAPAWWIREKLTWEDAIRPASEPMSVVVPAPYGSTEGLKESQMAKAKKKSPKAEFDNDSDVLYEVAQDLGIDPDAASIEEDSGLSGFGAGTVYRIESGRQEYMVVENPDQMSELALEVVKQDLNDEPEIFNQDFIEQHINIDRLRRDLESDELDSAIDRLTDDAKRHPDDFWNEYDREGLESPEEDENGERPEPTPEEIEELAEIQTKNRLSDPMDYLRDIYGDDAAKEAIRIAGIDIDAAAEEAVDTDGPEHFLAHYDGESHETKSGFVYWRAN